MLDSSESLIQAGTGRIDRLLQAVCGKPRNFPVSHQALNWLFFSGVLLLSFGGIENTLLGLTPTWPMFTMAGLLALAYYTVRFRRRFVGVLAVAVYAAWLLLGIIGWYANAGLLGSLPLFMLLFTAYLTVFRSPLSRLLAMGCWLAAFSVLAGLQLANPASVPGYPTPRIAMIDLTFSVTLVSLYLIGYVVILSYNLERRRKQADQLLLNILPRSIVEQLEYEPDQIVAESIESASVLFADVVGFTPLSEGMAASDLVNLLDEVFSAFDALVQQRGLEKIKTIGDCYMVAAGVPEPRTDHACVLTDLALAMQECVTRRTFLGRKLSIRIGIHSGPLVAGVIGRKKFIYDLWGDTVNTASRMEAHGVPGSIQITRATRELIEPEFICELRGTIAVKGKGEMPVWFVTGRR